MLQMCKDIIEYKKAEVIEEGDPKKQQPMMGLMYKRGGLVEEVAVQLTDFFCNLQVYRVDRSNKNPRSIPRVSSSGKRGILLKLILEQRMVPDCVLGDWSDENRNNRN